MLFCNLIFWCFRHRKDFVLSFSHWFFFFSFSALNNLKSHLSLYILDFFIHFIAMESNCVIILNLNFFDKRNVFRVLDIYVGFGYFTCLWKVFLGLLLGEGSPDFPHWRLWLPAVMPGLRGSPGVLKSIHWGITIIIITPSFPDTHKDVQIWVSSFLTRLVVF